jgi:hypothetical protein
MKEEDASREISFADNSTAREVMAIADTKLAPELWASVDALIRSGRLTLEEFSTPIAQHLAARARLLK